MCLSAFGFFFTAAGAVMTYVAFFGSRSTTPFWSHDDARFVPPLQVAGPIFLVIGSLMAFLGLGQ